MKQKTLYTFIAVVVLCGLGYKGSAQSFGMEQNQDGSYTFDWGNGTTITTTTNGTYNAANGTGSCSGCAVWLPEVTVYGYRNTSTPTPTYTYTSYYHDGEYYNMPNQQYPPPYTGGGSSPGTPSTVITTNPTPVPPAPAVPDPCKGHSVSSNGNSGNASTNINNAAYAPTATALTATIATDANERSAFFGVNTPTGQLITSVNPSTASGVATGTIPAGMVPFGGMHTHTSSAYPTPSAGDIYALANINASYPSYQVSYVLAADGSRYALMVTDRSKVTAFVSNYPKATTAPADAWLPNANPTGIFHDYTEAYNNVNPTGGAGALDEAAYERAQSYILDKYDTGITLVKADATGNYTEIHTVRTVNAAGTVSYSKYNCK